MFLSPHWQYLRVRRPLHTEIHRNIISYFFIYFKYSLYFQYKKFSIFFVTFIHFQQYKKYILLHKLQNVYFSCNIPVFLRKSLYIRLLLCYYIIAPLTKHCRQILGKKKIFLRQKNLKCDSIPAFSFLDKFPFCFRLFGKV